VMEIINTIIAVVAAVGSLVVIVGTVVWAVSEIKSTTQTLAIEIKHLGERIKEMSDGFDDHEERLRGLEQKR
jgi:prefoldin subunit 5